MAQSSKVFPTSSSRFVQRAEDGGDGEEPPSVSEPSEIRLVSEVFVEFMFPKYRVPQVEAERFWWFLVLSQQ